MNTFARATPRRFSSSSSVARLDTLRRAYTRRPIGSCPPLWSGYAAPNILKWHWWRFNGWGYFYGMISGIAGALALARDAGRAAVGGISRADADFRDRRRSRQPCHRTRAESVLVDFYTRTRPWGWWGPIRSVGSAELHPEFQPNRDFGFDVFNVVVGIVWQTSFVALPIYVVIQHWHEVSICLAIIAVTSAILKRTWYDRLEVA